MHAEWFTAVGTIFLGLVTVILHFIGDSYTRLIKSKASYDFKKQAFEFLNESLCSWGPMGKVPSKQEITVQENIDNFSTKLIDNKIYLSFCDKRRFKKYTRLAQDHANAWKSLSKNEKTIKKFQRKIVNEMLKIATEIGKDKYMRSLQEEYPYLF